MVDNGEFQVFVNELPRYLWNALEGKYEVCIDIFQSERYGQVAVVVAKKEGECLFVRELTEGFAISMEKYKGNLQTYAEDLATSIKNRSNFIKNSKV